MKIDITSICVLICTLSMLMIVLMEFRKQSPEKQLEKVKEWLLYAVTLAEKNLGSGTGALKLRQVYDMFLDKFPQVAKVITFAAFSAMVDEALEKMKSMLSQNEAAKDFVDGE